MSEREEMLRKIWGSRSDEWRGIAKDCIATGRPDLALAALQMAAQEEAREAALSMMDFHEEPLP